MASTVKWGLFFYIGLQCYKKLKYETEKSVPKNKVVNSPTNNKNMESNTVTISVNEIIPFLTERLNMSTLSAMMGKSNSWFRSKITGCSGIGKPFPFTEKDCETLNKVISEVSAICMEHILESPTVCTSKTVYAAYASARIKSLGEYVKMKYLRENFTSISHTSWQDKLASRPVGKYVSYFSEKDIQQINEGISSLASMLSSFRIVLSA